MSCNTCGGRVQSARANLGLSTCLACAQALPTARYRGAMIYNDKTTSSICLMSPDEYKQHKKLTNRRGQQSILRNVIVANGRAL